MTTKDTHAQKLKARAGRNEAVLQFACDKEIEALRPRQIKSRNKLDEPRVSGEDAWEDLTAGAEKAWKELGDGVRSAVARF